MVKDGSGDTGVTPSQLPLSPPGVTDVTPGGVSLSPPGRAAASLSADDNRRSLVITRRWSYGQVADS